MKMNNYFHGNNKFIMKLTSIFIIIAFVSMLFPSKAIAVDESSLFAISRTVDTTNIKVGDSFNVNYNITPSYIPFEQDTTVKDIVLVLDTSGSMDKNPSGGNNGDSKLKIIKSVANNFINAFKNDANVNIGIVDFNNIAKLDTLGLLNVSQKLVTLNNEINDLSAGGGTNIGDGLRSAYYLLNDDNGHNKYIIFMTDGQATFYSVVNKNNNKYVNYVNKFGQIGYYNCKYYNNFNDTNGYYFGSSDSQYISGPGSGDTSDKKCFNYAKDFANQYLSNSSIKTTMIGFGSDADPNNDGIARAANNIKSGVSNPYYYSATDKNSVTNIYNSMQQQIATTIHGTANFTETFDSSKLQVDTNSLPAGLTVNGNKITGKIDISYTLSADKTKYVAAPVSLPITFKAKAYGDSVLGKNNDSSSSVTLTVSNKTETQYFKEYTFSIGQTNRAQPPAIEANTQWTKDSVPVKITPGAKGDSDVVGTKYELIDLNDNIIQDWTTINSINAFTFNVDKEGQTKIIARTIDHVEESADSEPVVVKIDRTAPTAPIINTDTIDWTNSDVNFTIYGSTDKDSSGNDGSGVSKYQYKIDDGAWQDYNEQVTISTEGQHTIYAKAIDNVGNVSSTSSAVVKIDKTNPTAPAIHPDTVNWTNKDDNFTVDSSTDKDGTGMNDGSGINGYQYKVDDNGTWQDYNDIGTVSAEGQHTLYAQAIDNAGNISDSSNVVVKIDKTIPTLSYTLDHSNLDKDPVKIFVSVGDALSGVEKVINPDGSTANLDAANKEVYTVNDNGNYLFKVYDKAGNEYVQTVTITNIVSLKLYGTVDNENNANDLDWNKPGLSQDYSYKVFRYSSVNSNLNSVSSPLGQVTQIPSGDSQPEQKLIDGTLLSLIQTTASTSLKDYGGKDLNAPNTPSLNIDSVSSDGAIVNIKFDAVLDTGTDYKYLVEAIGESDGYTIDSNIVSLVNISGLKGYYVSVDNDADGVPTNTVLTSSDQIGNIQRNYEGKDFYVHVVAVDNAGNISPVSTYHYDREAPAAPVITVTPDDNVRIYNVDALNKNASGDVTFTVGGSTDTSTPLNYEYNLDGNGWTTVAENTPVPVMGEGNHIILARVTDARGNVSSTTTQNILIDMTSPTKPSITLNPNVIDWTNQDVSFTIDGSSDSGSGLKKYQYKIDNGSWIDYTGSVTVSNDGQHVIYARAVDNVGNISEEATKGINIDKTAPSAPTIFVTPDSAKTQYTKEDVTFSLLSTDLLSGIDKYQYQINGTDEGKWVDYDGLNESLTDSGDYTIYARAIDKAGNISPVSNEKVYIDKGPSVPTITGITDWTNSDVTFTIDGSKDVKGNPILNYEYKIDDGDWKSYDKDEKITISVKKEDGSSNEGIHTITARAKDNLIADFYSAEAPAVEAKIDTTPPPKPTITSKLSTEENEAEVTIEYPEDITGVEGQQASGLKDKKYTVNGQDYNYTGPFKVTQGSVIYAKVVDFAGNVNDNYATAVTANFIADDYLIVPRSDEVKNYAANFKFSINGVGQDKLLGATGSVTVTDEKGNPVSNSYIQLRIGSIDTSPSQALNEIANDTTILVSAPVTTPEGTYYIKLTSPSVTDDNSKIIKLYVKNLILH